MSSDTFESFFKFKGVIIPDTSGVNNSCPFSPTMYGLPSVTGPPSALPSTGPYCGPSFLFLLAPVTVSAIFPAPIPPNILNNVRPIKPVALVSGSGINVNPIKVPARPPS